MMGVNWGAYKDFEYILEDYMPYSGEGDTMASQIVTAVNKLVYKWYNDGDVFDNTHYLEGWANDLSSYANWLYKHVQPCRSILTGIFTAYTDDDYEDLLFTLASLCLNEDFLFNYVRDEKQGSIYHCDGPFHFEERYDDDDEEYYEEDDYDEYDDDDIESATELDDEGHPVDMQDRDEVYDAVVSYLSASPIDPDELEEIAYTCVNDIMQIGYESVEAWWEDFQNSQDYDMLCEFTE